MTNGSLDCCLRLLANQHRREILQQLLAEGGGEMAVDCLVDRICRNRASLDGSTLIREQLAVELHHIHLPKLAEHGVIDYEPDAGTVRYLHHDSVEAVLELLPSEREIPS